MASKKNNLTLYLFLLLIVVGAGVWYFSKTEKKKDKTEIIREGMRFATKMADVQKIFIAQRDGTTSTLERKDDYWITDGKHKANPNIMRNMAQALGGVRVKYIPTRAASKNIIKEMAAIGIKVELYGKNDALLKTFYVGGATNDETGTYMIMDGSSQPYVTHIPAMEGGLRHRFLTKGDTWRDKSLFSEKAKDVKFINIDYPKQKDQAFKLKRLGEEEFSITPFYDIFPASEKEINTNAVHSFLIGYKNVLAEGFENASPKRDSVLQTEPFSIITLGKADGSEKTIRFFPLDADETRAGTGESLPVHRYYADVDNEDFMLTQQRVIGKLFWGYGQFFK